MALLNVRTAAGRLGIAYSPLERMGRVRTTRTEGGHHRIAESEIERLLAVQDVSAPPASRPAPDLSEHDIVGLSARNRAAR